MKGLFGNARFRFVAIIIACLIAGGLLSAMLGHGETAQSAVVGTVTAPLHFAAQKISLALDSAFGNVKGNAAYEKKIASLEDQLDDYKAKLADYEKLKKQNELYKDSLGLKEEHPEYTLKEATVIARDSADIYGSFTISIGSFSGVKEGNAVLYKQNLLGLVDKVYPDYSVVKTVLDPDVNISAYEIISGEISYVTGNARLAKEGKCKMANLSASTEVAYGSIICTAGIGGSVPKGLVIGTVDEIAEEPTNISSYAAITPETDINDVTDCLVLTDF
jgi:rod shape-determining protein MreC